MWYFLFELFFIIHFFHFEAQLFTSFPIKGNILFAFLLIRSISKVFSFLLIDIELPS